MRLAIALTILLAGCGGSDAGPSDGFIAGDADFADFASWPHLDLPSMDATRGHDSGVSHVYLAGTVPAPALPFAVGTMIVKVTETGPTPPEWEVHAMVKRGGGYNASGAVGWEWFDLDLGADGVPVIEWRGEGSAADPGSYGGLDTDAGPGAQTCNACHGAVSADDYVFSRATLGHLD